MKRVLVAALLLAMSASTVYACGDKFLVWGRTARQDQITPQLLSARVLIFNTGSGDISTQMQGTLRAFGHKVDTASSSTDLSKALSSNTYDIVVADYSEAANVVGTLKSMSSDAMVLPVVPESDEDQFDAIKKEYDVALKANAKASKIVNTIEETLEKKQSLAMKK